MVKQSISSIKIWASTLLLFWGVVGCQKKDFAPSNNNGKEVKQRTEERTINWIPGEAYFKVAPNSEEATRTLGSSLRASLRSTSEEEIVITPVFEIGGEYEPAQRRHGLDRWYKVTFSKDRSVDEVLSTLKENEEIEVVHGALPVVRSQAKFTAVPAFASSLRGGDDSRIADYNQGFKGFHSPDPLLKKQWHYQNDGYEAPYQVGFTKGADINLFPAWEQETGKNSVIVAIIDSGVDYTHEDLRDAMWNNPKEPGTYGWNFYDENSNVEPDFHGTHVAGTVGARSNNGIGVSGIAGGNGTTGSGVQLMSLQIFNQTGQPNLPGKGNSAWPDGAAKAFKFAAEHGAVIANCSWGMPHQETVVYDDQIPQVVIEAMDYFIQYAGCDAQGVQKPNSPMKGGVVIVASGNDGARNVKIVPAHYDKVIAVGAFDNENKLTNYTNTGDWVDIMAPGGLLDGAKPQINWTGVLSTITPNFDTTEIGKERDFYGNLTPILGKRFLYPTNDKYAYAQGTSMATPHVSGIAALVVSKFGHNQPGFTNDQLKERLLNALKPINHHALNNKEFVGKIGRGYIDAARVLEEDTKKVPAKVDEKNIKVEADYFTGKITWQVVEDEDAVDKVASKYEVYLSTEEFGSGSLPEGKRKGEISGGTKAKGEELEFHFTGLTDGVTYYVAIVAVDRWGNRSDVAYKSFTTTLNNAPEVAGAPSEPVLLKNTEPFKLITLTISDKEDHTWDYKVTDAPAQGFTIVRQGNKLNVTIVPQMEPREYTTTITITDQLGKPSEVPIKFTVLTYSVPKVVGSLPDVNIGTNDAVQPIPLAPLFEVAEGYAVTYSAESNTPLVATASISSDGKNLLLEPKGEGTARITVTLTDGFASRSLSFQVTVEAKSNEMIRDVYPKPAHNYLKIVPRRGITSLSATVTTSRGDVLIKKQLLVKESTGEATLHISSLAPGVYVLHINTGNEVVRKTFVKR